MRTSELHAVEPRAPRQGPAARGPALRRRPPRADLADRPRRLHRHLRLQLPDLAVGVRRRRLPRGRRHVRPLQHADGGRLPGGRPARRPARHLPAAGAGRRRPCCLRRCWRSWPRSHPAFWLFALLLVPIGMFGLTVNVTANSSVQMATDPAMRGRVMALFMMVFIGGTPLGAPIVGWITDTYGPRIGFAAGGVDLADRRRDDRRWSWPGSAACGCRWICAPRPSTRVRVRASRSGRSRRSSEPAAGVAGRRPQRRGAAARRASAGTGSGARVRPVSGHETRVMRLFAAVLPPARPSPNSPRRGPVEDPARCGRPALDRPARLALHARLHGRGRRGRAARSVTSGWSGPPTAPPPSRCGCTAAGTSGTGGRCGPAPRASLDELRLLADRADAAARRAGVAMEEHRRYTPHLTVARSRGRVDCGRTSRRSTRFDGHALAVTELALVRSNLPSQRGAGRAAAVRDGRPSLAASERPGRVNLVA